MTDIKYLINRGYRYGEEHVATVAFVSLGLGVILAAAAIFGFFREGEIEQRVTRVEHSACAQFQEDASDHKAAVECAVVRSSTARTEPIEGPCISHQRVTGDRGRNCPRFYVNRQKAKKSARGTPRSSAYNSGPVRTAEPGGHSASPPSGIDAGEVGEGGEGHNKSPENLPPNHQAPVQHGSGGSQQGPSPQPSQPSQSAPSSTASESTSTSSTSTTTERVVEPSPSAPEVPQPVSSGVGSVLEGAGSALNEVGKGLGETVGEVGKGVGCLLGRPC